MESTSDNFAEHYSRLIEGTYDCVDRIVVNAYYPVGQTGGGFRSWWRNLLGNDEKLNASQLKAMAGDFARRLHAYCNKNQIPWIECRSGEPKHQIAEELLLKNPQAKGVFAVLVGRAPAPLWQIDRNAKGQIVNVRRPKGWPHVQHYYFQIHDPEWGHVMIRMCGYPPFGAQVILNGHEWVQRQSTKKGYSVHKEGNCFVGGKDFSHIGVLAQKLVGQGLVGMLDKVCKRWLYSSCLCFGLSLENQKRSNFYYALSIWQVEYSRNFLFKRPEDLEEVYQKMIDRTRQPLAVEELKTIFGVRHRRPSQKKRAGRSDSKVSKEVSTPQYDFTIFKLRWDNLVLKMYDKAKRVLRTEAMALNVADLKAGKILVKLPGILERMGEMVNRFLNVVQVAHISFLDEGQFERWTEPVQRGKRRLAGIDLNKARNRAVVEAVMALATKPDGFSIGDLAVQVRSLTGWNEDQYPKRKASYDLAKLKGKELVVKVQERRCYEIKTPAMGQMCAYLILRDKVIKPVLAGMSKPTNRAPLTGLSPVDAQYIQLRQQLVQTCEILGVAA